MEPFKDRLALSVAFDSVLVSLSFINNLQGKVQGPLRTACLLAFSVALDGVLDSLSSRSNLQGKV